MSLEIKPILCREKPYLKKLFHNNRVFNCVSQATRYQPTGTHKPDNNQRLWCSDHTQR